MKEPDKYVNLINLFLEKRDPNRGGVDGHDTDFSFEFSELAGHHIRIESQKELEEKLKILASYFYTDRHGREAKVIGGISKKENKYVLSRTTTDGLQYMKDLILESQEYSWFTIKSTGIRKGMAGFSGSDKTILLLKRRWIILKYLIKRFRKPVTYNALIDEVIHTSGMATSYNRDPNVALKQLQDDVAGLRRRLNQTFGFVKTEAIDNVPGKGYILLR